MKQHYAGLDGLRGVAAIAVMFMHEIGIFRPGLGPAIHAYVAVDLFFMLSGFVLAFAYDERLDRGMRWRDFMTVRVIRLYPLLVAGTCASAAIAAIKLLTLHIVEPGESLWLLPAGLLLVPTGVVMGHPTAFMSRLDLIPFGGPAWSLLFEFIASAIFATRLRRSGVPGAVMLAPIAIVLIVLTIAAGRIGVIGSQGYIGVPGGVARVLVPFAMGTFLFRHRLADRLPRVPVVATVVVGAVLCCLPLGDAPIYDLACVFLLFPLLIAFAAQPPSSRFWYSAFTLLGALSYPLYLLHVPISRMIGFVAKIASPSMSADTLIVLSMAGSVAGSFLALYFFDEPVRRWLTARLRQRTPLAPTPPITGELPFEQHGGVSGRTDQA